MTEPSERYNYMRASVIASLWDILAGGGDDALFPTSATRNVGRMVTLSKIRQSGEDYWRDFTEGGQRIRDLLVRGLLVHTSMTDSIIYDTDTMNLDEAFEFHDLERPIGAWWPPDEDDDILTPYRGGHSVVVLRVGMLPVVLHQKYRQAMDRLQERILDERAAVKRVFNDEGVYSGADSTFLSYALKHSDNRYLIDVVQGDRAPAARKGRAKRKPKRGDAAPTGPQTDAERMGLYMGPKKGD